MLVVGQAQIQLLVVLFNGINSRLFIFIPRLKGLVKVCAKIKVRAYFFGGCEMPIMRDSHNARCL